MADLDDFYNQRIGTTLRGKWKIERLLGVGGMAAVYVAVHTIGHRVAVKILHPEVAASKELRDRFELEAHAVNRFSHPGAVAITDTDVAEDGCPFLVMELLEGEPLQDMLDREVRLQPADVLRFADELLDVLAAAHAHGIVHRDIKPDNLFVLKDGRLKVLDFGIARMKQGAPRTLHTRTGMAMGTITYMPPEQVRGEQVDGRADLFAAAATMFRLLTGRRIHQADSHADMLVKMASLPAPPLASVVSDVSENICKVVDCGLSFRKEDRYPDALTMQADVRAIRTNQPPAFAVARAMSLALAPTLPSTATPGVLAGAAAIADGPTRAEPVGPAVRVPTAVPSPQAPAAVPQVVAAPLDPTAPMTVPGAGPPPASAASPRVDPPTWVSAEPAAPISVGAVLTPAVRVVSRPPPARRKSNLVLIIALILAVLLVGVLALVFGIHLLTSSGDPADSAAAATSAPTDPASTSSDTPLVLGTAPRPPGKVPPSSTSKTPASATGTSTAAPPATTATGAPPPTATGTSTGAPPATNTAAPPATTGKTPPGQTKDKDKKHK